MPQYLPIPAEEDFGGLDTVSTPDSVRNLNTPDSRNDDISAPGAVVTRKGLEKQNTTAYSYALNYMIAVEIKGATYRLYIDANGSAVTI